VLCFLIFHPLHVSVGAAIFRRTLYSIFRPRFELVTSYNRVPQQVAVKSRMNRLHLPCRIPHLKIEIANSSEKFIPAYQTTRCHKIKDYESSLCEDLEFCDPEDRINILYLNLGIPYQNARCHNSEDHHTNQIHVLTVLT
jgi:hypothetical protein